MVARGRHGVTRVDPFNALLAAGFGLLGFLLLGPVLTIPLHIPIDYNEGWNAGFATRAVTAGAGPLYPGSGDFVFDNYPPLGFFIVGWLGRFVFGDMIVAGRVVALAGLLGSAALLGVCLCRLGVAVRAGAASGLLLLLFACCYYRQYVAMDDPQWLGHALMLAGLAVLLRGGAARLRTRPVVQIVTAALLMVAGGFVKHTLVGLPLATTLWLAWLDRRAACLWVVAAATFLAAGLGATEMLFGPAAFADILHHRRVIHAQLMIHALERLEPLLPMAAVAGLALRHWRVGDGVGLAASFGGIALVTGVVQRMGEGVYFNAHFETVIAACLAFGLAVGPALRTPAEAFGRRFGACWLSVFAATPVLGALPWHLAPAWHDIADRTARQAAWAPMIARLAAADGPVGCETPSLCTWAGKGFAVDLFNLSQSAATGGPYAGFQALVRHRGFALFEAEPASYTHRDTIRQMGADPIMAPFAGVYAQVARGPAGTVLLAPVRQGTQ